MPSFTIKKGNSWATINQKGAWVESLIVDGKEVLYPKSVLENANGEQKARGGCHVCLPNFGPDAKGALPQHGFARDSDWTLLKGQQDALLLRLQITDGKYAGLQADLHYVLNDRGISMSLRVSNKADRPLSIAPAFHPYFVGSDSCKIHGKVYDTTRLNEPQILSGPPGMIEVNDIEYTLKASNLSTWVVWSDMLDGYVCVEPTQSGFSFADTGVPEDAISLGLGQSWKCSMTIEKKGENK